MYRWRVPLIFLYSPPCLEMMLVMICMDGGEKAPSDDDECTCTIYKELLLLLFTVTHPLSTNERATSRPLPASRSIGHSFFLFCHRLHFFLLFFLSSLLALSSPTEPFIWRQTLSLKRTKSRSRRRTRMRIFMRKSRRHCGWRRSSSSRKSSSGQIDRRQWCWGQQMPENNVTMRRKDESSFRWWSRGEEEK